MASDRELSALERLADLRIRGMLTEEQFEAQKIRILNGRRTLTFRFVIAVLAGVAAVVAISFVLFERQSAAPSEFVNQPVNATSNSAPEIAGTPSTAAVTASADPAIPTRSGVSSDADPIAQSASQAEGMTPDTSLNVAGRRVVLYKRDGDGVFDASYVLMVGTRAEVLEEGQIYSIEAVGPFVVLEIDSGGTACPAIFQIIDVAGGRISRSFGTCSDLIRSHVASDGSLVSIVHRFNVGGPVIARYAHGVLTTWGEH